MSEKNQLLEQQVPSNVQEKKSPTKKEPKISKEILNEKLLINDSEKNEKSIKDNLEHDTVKNIKKLFKDKISISLKPKKEQLLEENIETNNDNQSTIAINEDFKSIENNDKKNKFPLTESSAFDLEMPDLSAIEFLLDDKPIEKKDENYGQKKLDDIPNNQPKHHNQQKQNSTQNKSNDNQEELQESETNFTYPPCKDDTIIVKTLKEKSIMELTEMAEKYGVQNYHRMLRQDLITSILKQSVFHGKLIYSEGIIEVGHDGHGFVRSQSYNYAPCSDDIFISNNQIRKFGLRFGDQVAGYARVPKKGEKYFSLLRLSEINGRPSDEPVSKINFDNLTPLYPQEKLNFECIDGKKEGISTRVIDLISPIGKGQRALIVAQPKSGKTMLMQSIAHAINRNHPEIYLIYLGIDERPEEFTEMQRTIKGEVVSSTFDEPAKRHVELAEIVIEKAKRLVEQGMDVVILLDSITRLARAYNNVLPSSGKILSGGVDSNALHRPKRFFGAARNIEDGGSLTIIATALVDTGSKMDEVIFEEFKGTGNSEIVLDRKIADRRVFPAIDVLKSGTRKEEEMVSLETLTKMWMLRRVLTGMGSGHEALEFLIKKIKETPNNEDFFKKMNSINGN